MLEFRKKKPADIKPVRWKVLGCIGILLLGLSYVGGCGSPARNVAENESAGELVSDIYADDHRLELISHETCAYDKDSSPVGSGLYSQYMWAAQSYNEEEKAELSHAYFDEQDRLSYVLGYSPNILTDRSSYCEENIYQWDDARHSCRYVYYKSNSMPYQDGYYVAFRYMFEVSDLQFDEESRLRSYLSYRRNVGSDPNGYSEELFFNRGYQADYDGAYLMEELQYYDYWGTNEGGAWEHCLYQYNEQGDCVLKVVTTEEEITLCSYEYDVDAGQMDEYIYQVTDDWELSCEDGSVYYFCPQWGQAAIRKVAADGTVEKELFYGKAMDLGQQHYLMPEEAEDTIEDHTYMVRPGDCLWDIAYERYGRGSYYDLIYRVNRSSIGSDEELLLPGTRLYLPEAGSARDTKVENWYTEETENENE